MSDQPRRRWVLLTGCAFLAGAALLGFAVVSRLGPLRKLLGLGERILWGVIVGWMLATFGAYFIARLQGHLAFKPLVGFTLVIWAIALLLLRQTLRRPAQTSFKNVQWSPEYTSLAVVLLLFGPFYWKLFSSHLLEPGPAGVYSGGSSLYDLGFHLAIATSFAHGQNFPPLYTVFPPAPLLYPFLADFQIAVLATLGMNLRTALLITSVPLALTITGLFFFFARRLLTWLRDELPQSPYSMRNGAAMLGTILFLLNGGLGFIYLVGDWRRSGRTLAQFWSGLEINYANLAARNILWANFIADCLLPQRGSLFGYAVALMVFTLFAAVWHNWHTSEGKKSYRHCWGVLLIAGVLTGLLPLFHTHVYFGIGLVSGFLFLLKPRRQWIVFWAAAVLLALPHLIDLAGHVSTQSFMRFQPGWRGQNESFWPWFWLRNIGLPTLLIIPAWFVAPPQWRKFYLAFVCLLVFSLLVVVSPNDFDNIKLMYLWYAPTSILVAAWLLRLATVQRMRLVAPALALLCVASGLLALQAEVASHTLMYTSEEMVAADFAREHTPPQALFLTAPALHQPILSLAGRPILRGATAWLWSHGYDFADREADVKTIYAGGNEAEALLKYYGIDYVYLGPREHQEGAKEDFFARFPRVYSSENIAIYQVGQSNQPLAVPAPREFASRLDRDPHQFLIEFPRVSFSVYCFYKTALGRRPRYQEFVDDLKIIGRGLYVGAPGWEQVLENNKNRLAEAWLERPEVKNRYDANARSMLLRSQVEICKSVQDYNEAYVLVHYFGYLRRNPDDPPDHDMTGFEFWLNDLNRSGDYRSVGRRFIESGEYKERDRGRQ